MMDANDRAKSDDSGLADEAGDEDLGRLFHLVGRRPEAPEHVVARIQRATRPAWQAKVREVAAARRRRRRWTLAMAAVLLLSLGGGIWRIALGPNPAVRVATIERATAGSVAVQGRRSGPLQAGAEIVAGSAIETGAGSHVTLRLVSGTSVRLDADSRLRLRAADALILERGAVYLDTGSGSGQPLAVATRYGVARDIGTQFEVRLLEDALRVLVREGEVEVEADSTIHSISAGSGLTLDAAGVVQRQEVAAHGSSWRWILLASPPFELEGRTLGELLEWVARETGWQVRFAEADLEQEVWDTVLHGSIAEAPPDQAPDLVLPGVGLRHRLEDGVLWIEAMGDAR